MEELSNGVERQVPRKRHISIIDSWSSCYLWFMDLTCFFDTSGRCNDINYYLHWLSFFNDIFEGIAPQVTYNFKVIRYYLTDGIYPAINWSPLNPKQKLFQRVLEGVWKDVEQAFNILLGHFHRTWN